MNSDYLIYSVLGKKLYEKYKQLPIYDYHCHLSPREIYEGKPFEDISDMMLGHDHYKWRLMRCFGADEKYITGNESPLSKFKEYARCLETAAGNPLYYWTHMELSKYFGIEEYLNSENAEEIYNKANKLIAEKKMSPRSLIEQSGVKYIATTDDVCDDLQYHALLAAQNNSFKVSPSFRTDRILSVDKPDFAQTMRELSECSGITVSNLTSYKKALSVRMDYFISRGCRFSDVGLACFPSEIYSDTDAQAVFKKAADGGIISASELGGFLGNMYVFLAGEYRKKGLVMQLHLGVWRNANTALFNSLSADCGVDCMGEDITPSQLIKLLDIVNTEPGLPKTIIYSLKPALYPILSNISSSFSGCISGAAWWFCDNKRGIEEQIKTLCEQGHIGKFYGMLTDSRSFLSYARHDFFRRIFCNCIGELCDRGEFDYCAAEKLTEAVFCENIRSLTEG